MKVCKYSIIGFVLLFSTVVFGQKQTKIIEESFKVNKDVIVDIKTADFDVTVKIWNKNTVSISGTVVTEGLDKAGADTYFKEMGFEALANKSKVVISSKSKHIYYMHSDVLDDIDIDIESISHIGEMFEGDYFVELSTMPAMSPMPPMPPFPAPAIEHLSVIEFDYDAYKKDKEGYMKAFKKSQEAWEKEFEEKLEPQMKAYEEKMKKWEKKMKPQMKAYEDKMKKWEIEVAPQLEKYEIKIAKKLQEMENKMEIEFTNKMEKSKSKTKKSLVIHVPTNATIKLSKNYYGKINLPDGIKVVKN